MRITTDNMVKTRLGDYPCQDREQAEALMMTLQQFERERQRRPKTRLEQPSFGKQSDQARH